MKKNRCHCKDSTLLVFVLVFVFFMPTLSAYSQSSEIQGVFDDAKILAGYSSEYADESKETIVGRINDDAINFYQIAAAINVFKQRFAATIVGREKARIEQDLIRRINRTNSAFIEVEIMHTLCLMDRYKYFDAMVPALILKLDHYNTTVNLMAETALDDIIAKGKNSSRDARIVFNTLRNVLFLSRNTLRKTTKPDARLERKLKFLRWSIKILGAQELKRLPKECLRLL